MFIFTSMRKINHKGSISGRLTVIEEINVLNDSKKKRVYWLCKCECGNEIKLVSDSIGKTKSCGCLLKEMTGALNFKHGEAKKTKENKTWFGIKSRCYNKNDVKYVNYGGRGVVVCNRWLNSYESFLLDMGRAPSKDHSIDRIDVNGNYDPGNCRWANSIQQMNNTTRNVYISHNGVSLTLAQWARELNMNYKTLYHYTRYKGFSISDLINNQ